MPKKSQLSASGPGTIPYLCIVVPPLSLQVTSNTRIFFIIAMDLCLRACVRPGTKKKHEIG
ncbi:MAG: hypothetical protein Ct9H300mP7_0840 [Verrucomicrobiota bacterium]|nr:MAG: hypothetical protein Ct9H300mP7_0840 [Verrucomicrobiota bacterium]